MIISKTPFRIPLGGGGTDLPFFYEKYGGFILSAAVQKFMYIIVSKRFEKNFRISYSKTEICNSVDEIEHPIVREALKLMEIENHLEIISLANLPASSGLGSSGSFTVGLLNALHKYSKKEINKKDLAEMACHIEMDLLKEPSGKQDQYIATFGGFTCFEIDQKGNVVVSPLNISQKTKEELEKRLCFFYTGITRPSSQVINDQRKKSKNNISLDYLLRIKEIGLEIKKSLENNHLENFGNLLDQHWEEKKKTSNKISNNEIDNYYKIAKDMGVRGGKVMGAGGGGFLMFFCDTEIIKSNLTKKFNELGLRQVLMPFEQDGSKIMLDVTDVKN